MMLPGVIAKRRVIIPPSWTPASLPGLYAWYQADHPSNTVSVGAISTLFDLSGNARHGVMTGGTPTLVTGGLGGRGFWSSALSGLVFVKVTGSTGFLNAKSAGNFGGMVVPSYAGSTVSTLFATETPSAGFARIYIRYPGVTAQRYSLLGRRLDADALQTLTTPANVTGNNALVCCVDYATATAETRVNGTSLFSSSFQTAGAVSATNANIEASIVSATGASGFAGSHYEYVMGNAAWSLSDRQKLEGYLCWRYGTQSDLPTGHPYKSSPP